MLPLPFQLMTSAGGGGVLAISTSSSPFLGVLQQVGTAFVEIGIDNNPASGGGVSITRSGSYVAVIQASNVAIYRRGKPYVKLTSPTAPAGAPQGLAWSPNGAYLAVTHNVTPYVTVYKNANGVLTKIADPAALPGGNGAFCAWSNDGVYLAVTFNATGRLIVYKREGDVLTQITAEALPAGTATGLRCAWSGDYLAVNYNSSPYLTVLKRTDDELAIVATPTVGSSATTIRALAWDRTNTYLVLGGQTTLNIFKRTDDTFDALTTIVDEPATPTYFDACFTRSGKLMVACLGSGLDVRIYDRNGDTFTYDSTLDTSSLPIGIACT